MQAYKTISAAAGDNDEVAPVDSDEDLNPVQANTKQKAKKKGMASKAAGFAALQALDADSDPEAEAEAEESLSSPTADKSASIVENGNGTAGFAALDLDDEDGDEGEATVNSTSAGFAAISIEDQEPDAADEPIQEEAPKETKVSRQCMMSL